MSRLSIIIVNYKSPQLVIDCLQTVYAGGMSGELEVIVVDNFSQDNSEMLIMNRFPQVRWIQMNYNSGFARGNNAGIRAAQSDTVLLLNSDTLNEGNAIQQCLERLSASTYIAAGLQLLNADRSPQISGNFFITGGLNHLMSLPYTGRIIRSVGLALNVKKTNVPEAKDLVEVDWINGAFLMVKRSACEEAGLLDEDFFLYSEEIEWCSRLKKQGKLCIYGDLHVVHLMGATTSKAFAADSTGYTELSDRKGLQLMLSGLLRIRKQFGKGWMCLHLLAYLFTIPVYLLLTIVRTPFLGGKIGKEWKGFFGFSKNTFLLFGYFFELLINKPYFYKVL